MPEVGLRSTVESDEGQDVAERYDHLHPEDIHY